MSSKQKLNIYWVRRDFRLQDNPALYNAVEDSKKENVEFIPLFVIDPNLIDEDRWNIGYPRRRYLAKILAHYALQFENFEIIIGKPEEVFTKLAENYELSIYLNSDIEPFARKRDAKVKELAQQKGGEVHAFRDQISVDKGTLSGSGTIYGVFSPFRKKIWDDFLDAPVVSTPKLDGLKYYSGFDVPEFKVGESFSKVIFDDNTSKQELNIKIYSIIEQPWRLTLTKKFAVDLENILQKPDLSSWYCTEDEVLQKFKAYNESKILDYKKHRDDLGLDVVNGGQTSKISVALKWGLVSSRLLKNMILEKHDPKKSSGVFSFVSELIWREFYRYVLYHRPNLMNIEYQPKYQSTIEWKSGKQAEEWFTKWIQGQTGYRVVDAAMNQIAREGWMHNRSRMIVASILTKNLGIDWRWGQEYFRSILLDLDEASNNGGWQWAASVGADPKPIRIFNPYTQAEKYDGEGKYQNKYLPADYNISEPLIEHKKAREEALERYKYAKEKGVRDY